MNNNNCVFSPDSEWVYRLFAHENQVDYLQLCVLDVLRSCGGRMTWKVLFETISSSNVSIRLTISDLQEQGFVRAGADLVELTETAHYEVEDVLDDLHRQIEVYLEKNIVEESPANLMA